MELGCFTQRVCGQSKKFDSLGSPPVQETKFTLNQKFVSILTYLKKADSLIKCKEYKYVLLQIKILLLSLVPITNHDS